MRQWTTVAWTLALWARREWPGPASWGARRTTSPSSRRRWPARRRHARVSPARRRPRRHRRHLGGTQVAAETEGRVEAAAQAAPAVPEARPLPRAGREPQWFKVRIVERATGRKKVTINLPLSLVRALGDDTIDWGCRDDGDRRHCNTVRLSEVFAVSRRDRSSSRSRTKTPRSRCGWSRRVTMASVTVGGRRARRRRNPLASGPSPRGTAIASRRGRTSPKEEVSP